MSEAYLQRLQAIAESRITSLESSEIDTREQDGIRSVSSASIPDPKRPAARLTLRNATAEAFVSGLKRLSTTNSKASPETNPANTLSALQNDTNSDVSGDLSNYDYVSLNFDSSRGLPDLIT